jgi:hypothetical protein
MQRSWRRGLTLGLGVSLALSIGSAARAQTTGTGADVVPGDCLAFTTSLKMKQQFTKFVDSPAFQKRMMPLVKKVYEKAKNEGDDKAKAMIAMLEGPQGRHVIATAGELLGNECFTYIDHDWMTFFEKLSKLPERLQGTMMMAAIGGGGNNPEKIIVPALIDFLVESKLSAPPIVMGFKPNDVKRFAEGLAQLPEMAANSPVKVEKSEINGSPFYTVALQGKMLNIPEDRLVEALEDKGVSEQRAKDFHAWIGEQTLSITLGTSGDYLILSVAADNNHLKKFGKGNPLSSHSALSPVREHLKKPNLLGLHYVSQELAMLGYTSPEQQKQDIDKAMAPAALFLPPGLGPKLAADIKEMIDYGAKITPKPSETVSVDLDNRGMESYSFTKAVSPAADYARPLGVLAHLGGTPFVGAAASSKSSVEDYQYTRTFFKKVYGYVNEFALPKMEKEQREKFKKYEAVVLPIVAEIDEITAKKFLPAVDACQTGFVIDFKAKAQRFPEKDLPKPMPIPELGLGFTINDGDLLREAVVGYVKAVQNGYQKVMPLLKEDGADDLPPSLDFPPPSSSSVGGAMQYFYPMPEKLDPAILPHVVLGKKFVAISSSPGLSQRMLSPSGPVKNEVVAIDQPSSSAAVVHLPVLAAALNEWAEFFKTMPDGPLEKAPPEAREFFDLAIGGTMDVWNTMKSSTTRVFKQGEYEVTHTWTHVDLSGQ